MKLQSGTSLLFTCLILLIASGCSFKSVKKSQNIVYRDRDPASSIKKNKLNVFAPRKNTSLKNVFIFIHGGNWNSGKKSLYNFLGRRMARKDVVVVIIDYPLSPQVTYNGMATAVSKAVRWVKQNIEKYGGNPEKIFISGHSAGGHLAALVSIREEYLDSLGCHNAIKGTILIDAAGLNMYGYLQEEKLPPDHTYFKTFTRNPDTWKEASPLYHLHTGMPPMLIYVGEKTRPSIINSHEKFIHELKNFVPEPNFKALKGKKHVPMITQFLNSRNPHYKEIVEFMKSN